MHQLLCMSCENVKLCVIRMEKNLGKLCTPNNLMYEPNDIAINETAIKMLMEMNGTKRF